MTEKELIRETAASKKVSDRVTRIWKKGGMRVPKSYAIQLEKILWTICNP